MAQFDLTPILSQYLDRHLVIPLLEFLSARDTYNSQDISRVKLEVLDKTNMIDYILDIRSALFPDEDRSEELQNRRTQVVQRLTALQGEVSSLLKVVSNPEAMAGLDNMRDQKALCNYLAKEFDFEVEKMDSLYKLAKYCYECGNYSQNTSYLYLYLVVMPSTDKNYSNVLWGKLASEILVQNWDVALEDLNKLRDFIDSNASASPLQLLQQRTWLIHWSLFVFFNHPKGKDFLIDMFFRPNYLNAIQTMCPHIMRYLATAVITNRGRRNALKDLVKMIQQESYTYKDPITEFVEHLYLNFDFEGARQKLSECQTVLSNDFFLTANLDDFIESARLMIFEAFCRIHQCISINMLAEKLNMKTSEAEHWIVNLIRNARLDAKLDSKLGHIVMGTQPTSPYQQLIDKMDSLLTRSEALEGLVERKIKGKTGPEIRWITHDF